MRKDVHIAFNLLHVLNCTEYDKTLSVHHKLNKKFYRADPIALHYFRHIVAQLAYCNIIDSRKGVGIKARRGVIRLCDVARALGQDKQLKYLDNTPAGKAAKKVADIYEFTDIYPKEK